jgi:hypothetical protein
MQDLLRRLTVTMPDPAQKLASARQILQTLPPTNQFRLRTGLDSIRTGYLHNDTNLWDTLLHEQDRAYSASEMHRFMAGAGLLIQAFTSYHGHSALCALQYDLDFHIADAALRAELRALPEEERQDLAEVIDGSLGLHTVYATRKPDAALDPTSPGAILSMMSRRSAQIIAWLAGHVQALPVQLCNGRIVTCQPSSATRAFLAAIDGRRTNAEIARALGWDDVLPAAVAGELRLPLAFHWLTGRTAGGSAWPPIPGQGALSLPITHEEPNFMVQSDTHRYTIARS